MLIFSLIGKTKTSKQQTSADLSSSILNKKNLNINNSNESSLAVSDCFLIISESLRNHCPTTLPYEFDNHDLSNNNTPKLIDFESLTGASGNCLSYIYKVSKNPS